MRSDHWRRVCGSAGTSVALSMTLLGTAAAGPDSGGSEWTLTAGTEYGRDDSRGSLVSVDYAGADDAGTAEKSVQRGQLGFGASGLHSDTPSTAASNTATAAGTTATTSGQVYLRYGIEALRGGVAFNSTRDQDYRDSQEWTGMLHSGVHGWAFDLDVSTRQTRFDGSPLAGNANCTLHDVGYGGAVTYTVGAWSAYGSGSISKYDNTVCAYSVAGPNAVPRLSSHAFQTLSGAFLDRAQLRAGGQIGQETPLLQSQFGAGLSHSWGRAALAFDYLHAKAEFGDTTQDGYAVSGTIPLLRAVTVKLTIGTTVTSSVSAPYGGLYFVVSL